MSDSGTMKCISHKDQAIVSGDSLSVDISPLVDAILAVAAAIKDVVPVVNVPPLPVIMPDINPTIHVDVPQFDAPAVHVHVPEQDPPTVEVLPADVVIQERINGEPTQKGPTLIEVNLPHWPILLMGLVPTIILIIDLVLRFQG